jgi:hypothetical protein
MTDLQGFVALSGHQKAGRKVMRIYPKIPQNSILKNAREAIMSNPESAAGKPLSLSGPGARKGHFEGRTLVLLAFNIDAATEIPHDLIADAQPQPFSLTGCLG